MKQKKVLVLGAAGAMGRYLVPKLCERGYAVDAVSLEDFDFGPDVRSIKAQAKDFAFRTELLKNDYDGIADFLTYPTNELVPYLPELLDATDHYIFLSSYRVYDNAELPIREDSPRLIDRSQDVLLANSDDYSIFKARGENILRSRERKNWTIVRPAVTYSRTRFQLVTLEAAATVARTRLGRTVVLPETARGVQATMSWAGDVSEMIARLLFNERARGETFTVSTSEHHTWGEIADFYREICGLKALWIDQKDFLRIAVTGFDRFPYTGSWQLVYDRLFDRVIDNAKILAAAGLRQEELTRLHDGLEYEISRCPQDAFGDAMQLPVNIRMDEYLKNRRYL